MRISNSDSQTQVQNQALAAGVTGAGSSGKASTSALDGASGDGRDEVYLSGDSLTVQSGLSARTEQLAALSQLVRGGQYNVPSDLISGSIISETLARSGRQ